VTFQWPVLVICVLWFFGCGFVFLRFPEAAFRIFAMGKKANARQVRSMRGVGVIALTAGLLLLIEVATGGVHYR